MMDQNSEGNVLFNDTLDKFYLQLYALATTTV